MPSANPQKSNYMCSLSKSMVNSSLFLNQFIPVWGIQPRAFRRSNKNLGGFRSFSQLKWAKLKLNSYPLPVGGTEHAKIAAVNLGKGSSTSVKVFSKFCLSFDALTSMSTEKKFTWWSLPSEDSSECEYKFILGAKYCWTISPPNECPTKTGFSGTLCRIKWATSLAWDYWITWKKHVSAIDDVDQTYACHVFLFV